MESKFHQLITTFLTGGKGLGHSMKTPVNTNKDNKLKIALNDKQNEPMKYVSVSQAQIGSILNSLYTKGIITKGQAKMFLVNLVADDKMSRTQMGTILSCLPAGNNIEPTGTYGRVRALAKK